MVTTYLLQKMEHCKTSSHVYILIIWRLPTDVYTVSVRFLIISIENDRKLFLAFSTGFKPVWM